MSAPTNCAYCGEELWSIAEADGVCVICKRIEREFDEPEPDAYDDGEGEQ